MASQVTPDDLVTWKLTDQCDTAGPSDKLITIECHLYCTLPAWQFGGVDYVKWLLCNEWMAGALVDQWAAPEHAQRRDVLTHSLPPGLTSHDVIDNGSMLLYGHRKHKAY